VPDTSRFLTALGRVFGRFSATRTTATTSSGADAASARAAAPAALLSPGQSGPSATVEVDPARLRDVHLTYAPAHDGEPDPGEIVWTWVPYEERDGRGKDRPVVIVSASGPGDFLAVQLTSKAHDGDRDFLSLGTGAWDSSGRPSWVRVDRVFRVRTDGMRREAASLDAERYTLLTRALGERYGWR
jgi:hypothetical protein